MIRTSQLQCVRTTVTLFTVAACCMWVVPTWAQAALPLESTAAPAPPNEQNSRRLFSIVPRISVEELWTNNSRIQDAAKQADLVTTVSPGIRITSDGARLKTYIDYSLNQILYARNSGSNEARNLLNSFGTFEAAEKFAYDAEFRQPG